MSLSHLVKTTTKAKRRLGLGHGSGRSKTSGRGTKGQKARRKISLAFEGGALPLVKRMPFLRGKARNKSFKRIPVVLNVEDLAVLSKGTVVDVASLAKAGLVKEKEAKRDGVKILGHGDLSVGLTVKLPVTQSAKAKIEKAGGSIQ